MPSRSILDRLGAGEVLVLDGGTGSELQKRGVDVTKGASIARLPAGPEEERTASNHGVWSATANLDAPDVVREVHESYLRAGADIITSNNFFTSRAMLSMISEGDRWEEYARRAVELARQARDATNPDAYVAGGFAPPSQGDLRREFAEVSRLLAESGVDFLLAEYMAGDIVCESPIADCVTAVDVCAQTGLPVFLGICNVSDKGTMFHGESIRDLVAALRRHPVAGILLMCSYPTAISVCLPELRKAYDGPIGAYGHLGYEENPNFGASPDEPSFIIDTLGYTPERYAKFAREWRDSGAQIIGGCCSTGPEHIAALPAAISG
jgi:S-methylmethionine-dependent homocysteine/selenocysteine methylase